MGMSRSVANRLFLAARLTWVALAVAVLAVSLIFYDGKPNSDIEEFLLYGMLLLSFPSGLLFGGLLALGFAFIEKVLGLNIQTSILEMVLTWTGFFVCGYVQWFRIAPWAFRRRQVTKPDGSTATEE